MSDAIKPFDWKIDEDGRDLPAQLRQFGESCFHKGWYDDDVRLHHAADQLEALEAMRQRLVAALAEQQAISIRETSRAEAAEQRVRERDEILLHVLPLVRIAMWNDTVRRIAALGITGSGSADK